MKDRILKIMLVDDHQLFSEGLNMLLSEIEPQPQCFSVANGQQAIDMMAVKKPDIVLMDLEMPGISGIDCCRTLLKLQPEIKVIALSMHAHEKYYTQMINAGASGFLLKDSNIEEVKQAISEVAAGRNYFSAAILEAILQNINRRPRTDSNKELSQREVEVLFHICKGYSSQRIADKLFISRGSVDKHRENILFKTETTNIASLVVYAIKYGYFKV